MEVTGVAERVADVNLGGGLALDGPVVNNARVVEMAAMTGNREIDPEDPDSGHESDDSASDERHWDRLSVGERFRLRRLIGDRATMSNVQCVSEKTWASLGDRLGL